MLNDTVQYSYDTGSTNDHTGRVGHVHNPMPPKTRVSTYSAKTQRQAVIEVLQQPANHYFNGFTGTRTSETPVTPCGHAFSAWQGLRAPLMPQNYYVVRNTRRAAVRRWRPWWLPPPRGSTFLRPHVWPWERRSFHTQQLRTRAHLPKPAPGCYAAIQ